jgi:hypothetical protein
VQVVWGKACAFLSDCTACGTPSKCVVNNHYSLDKIGLSIFGTELGANETAICAMLALAIGPATIDL